MTRKAVKMQSDTRMPRHHPLTPVRARGECWGERGEGEKGEGEGGEGEGAEGRGGSCQRG